MDFESIGWIVGFILVFLLLDYIYFKGFTQKSELSQIADAIRKSKHQNVRTGSGHGIIIAVDDSKWANAQFLYMCLKILQVKSPIQFLGAKNCSSPPTNLPFIRLPIQINYPALKNWCVLFSPYFTNLVLDVDSIPVQNLDYLFGYSQNLFWKEYAPNQEEDDTLQPSNISPASNWKYVQTLVPYNVEGNNILEKRGNRQQNGKIMLVQKTQPFMDKFIGLLETDQLISPDELPWIACEMSQTPYTFYPNPPQPIKGKSGSGVGWLGLDDQLILLDHPSGIGYINYTHVMDQPLPEETKNLLNAFAKLKFRYL